MSLFVRVFNNFWSHRKTAKLRSMIGNDALWIPPRLWSYASENQSDGDFSKYSAAEIAMLIGYAGDATTMLQALLKSGFLDPDQRIHDWIDHNGYHATYRDRAKKAARARWDGQDRTVTRKEMTGQDRRQALLQASASNASSINGLFTRLESELNELYRREPGDQWTYAEQSRLSELVGRPKIEEELREIIGFYNTLGGDRKYFPQQLVRLLQDWEAVLDRARMKRPRKRKPTDAIVVPAVDYAKKYAANNPDEKVKPLLDQLKKAIR